MNGDTKNEMKGHSGAYVDLILRKHNNRGQTTDFAETHESETYASKGVAIFEHEITSKKNVMYRYFKWDNYSQFFLSKEIKKNEVKCILACVLLKRKALQTDHGLRRFNEVSIEE